MLNDGMMMLGYGLGHWIMFALAIVLYVYPIGRILRRIGLSPYWALIALVPLVNLFGLWVLAFNAWPGRGEP